MLETCTRGYAGGEALTRSFKPPEKQLPRSAWKISMQGIPGRQILVLVGWSGNDVHGDFGYQGCTWIHQSRYLKTEADRKVAAEWPSKQKARVDRAILDLVDLKKNGCFWKRIPS